jgi:hypothetical protein
MQNKAFQKQFSDMNPVQEGFAWQPFCLNKKSLQQPQNARDAIRTHEPLQEWILSPSELAGLSYPRKDIW